MRKLDGFRQRIALAMAGGKSPWGGSSNNGGDGAGEQGGDGDKPSGPRNPWLPGGGSSGGNGGEEPRRSASIEDIFKNRNAGGPRRGGGGGGGSNFRLPDRPNGKSWVPLIIAGVLGAWLLTTSIHQVAAGERALVKWIGGKYYTTLEPGFRMTLPFPFQTVDKENVQEIRSVKIPNGDTQKLILTGDQNLVDLSYLIRWNINDLALFRYRLAEPVETVQEAAETAMRQSVAELDLDTVLSGEGRAQIEQNVITRTQAILNAYKAGINVQGIEIDKTDPPETVVDAFKDVSAAEQDAQKELNRARRYAQQRLAQAQGEAAAFNEIYEEYRLAPEVTRRRLYYETMESVLSQTDKTIVEPSGVTPYLPLPEIRRRSAQPAAEGQ